MSAKHLTAGAEGESLAAKFLQEKGCEIVLRNWRFKNLEVDLIVMQDNVLVFVEVKTRSQNSYGQPFEFVDRQKQQKLIRAADAYLLQTNYQGEIRFDIVSVLLKPHIEIQHIPDAFWGE